MLCFGWLFWLFGYFVLPSPALVFFVAADILKTADSLSGPSADPPGRTEIVRLPIFRQTAEYE